MVTLLYVAAALFVLLEFSVDSSFAETNLLVLATACFLLARLVRLERRLDRIANVQQASDWKRFWTWLWSKRETITGVAALLCGAGLLWYAWSGISQSVSALSPKHALPWLHAFLESSRIATIMLVWLPLGAFLAFMIVALIGFYAVSVATLLGFLPRKNQSTIWQGASPGMEAIVSCTVVGLAVWLLLVTTYAKKESDAFFALFSGLDQKMSSPNDSILIVVLAGWMPLAFLAKTVARRREQRTTKSG